MKCEQQATRATLIGTLWAIPDALSCVKWDRRTNGQYVNLRIINCGTEAMLIRKGQTLAKLTELRLDERGADQIMGKAAFMEAKRKRRKQGLTPAELVF